MLKNFFRSHLLKLLNIRGQAMVFFALLIPLLFLFVGVGLDLGWYYLNVSRLQNAADAAVVAGAQKLITTEDFHEYTYDGSISSIDETANATLNSTDTSSGDAVAKQYIIKNLGETRNVPVLNDDGNPLLDSEENPVTTEIIADNYSKGGDPEVTAAFTLKEDGNSLYYVVGLSEKIQHFFMPGWFDPMNAGVVAVAMLTKEGDNDPTIPEDEQKKLEDILNSNVIIGNWEVQNEYRKQTDKKENNKVVYLQDENGNYILDGNGNKIKAKVYSHGYGENSDYYARYGHNQYTGRWNHFQDMCNHYYPEDARPNGNHIRRETVVIQDDVSADRTRYGERSNVTATSASINEDQASRAYNPAANLPRTYNSYYYSSTGSLTYTDLSNGATKTYNVTKNNPDSRGRPYTWDKLDSINIDFVQDVSFNDGSPYLSEDWDLSLSDPYAAAANASEINAYPKPPEMNVGDRKYLRVHNSIQFEAPYKVRSQEERDGEQDVLWGRIESEPMITVPDALNGKGNVSPIKSFNSVRQIIINFNQSNCGSDDRPVILFYEGPERYDPDNPLRESKPIIVNFNAPFRAILYAPNSPVVVVGNYKNDFKGFIVAKKYMRLKTESDFVLAGKKYYKKYPENLYKYRFSTSDERFKFEDSKGIYFTANKDGTGTRFYFYKHEDSTGVYYTKAGSNERFVSPDDDYDFEEVYKSTDPNDTGEYYKLVEDGITMFTDKYGNVQYAEFSVQPTKCGQYDTFGRTDFTTHNYHIAKTSANNLLRTAQ